MKILKFAFTFIVILCLCSYFLTGRNQINTIILEQFIDYMESPLLEIDEVEVYDFGDHWLWDLLEVPVNFFVEIGYIVTTIFVGIVNSVWAITKILGL